MAVNRARLSLAELGEFDDLLTDALVDKVYYWTKIRKTKRLYLPNRRVAERDVAPIVAEYVVRARSVTTAVEKFEQLSGVQSFLHGMEEWKKNEFMKHVRRYIQIYHPEAPFEVNSTDRYTLFTHEACVNARRAIRTGETIKFLAGCMLLMTAEEEAALDDNSDFSVICTSRMKGTSVLLGPARFVNHDCDPNCKFITTNKENITIMAIRNIAMGEELTIKYSEDYFGENNSECLCQTCENRAQNGFAIRGRKTETTTAELVAALEKDSGAYSFRLGRRNVARASPGNQQMLSSRQLEVVSQLPVSVSTKQIPMPIGLALTPPLSDAGPPSEYEPPREAQPTATINTSEVTPPPDIAKAVTADTTPSLHPNPSASESSAVETKSSQQYSDPDDSDCDSELSEIDEEEYQKLLEIFSPSISAKYKNKRKRGYENYQLPSNSLKRTKPSSLETKPLPVKRTKAPSAKPQLTHQGPDTEKKVKRKRDPEEFQPPPKRSKPQMHNPFKPTNKRFPGDSAMIPKIGLKCICTDCGKEFYNQETWYVPMSCSRCLRHSKIYGLRWPKTFKRKNDQELEIQDPRELSRFVTVAELNKMGKRKREKKYVVKETKKIWGSGGGKKTGTVEEGTVGVMNGKITNKKGFETKETRGPQVTDNIRAITMTTTEGMEGKENISAEILAAKADERSAVPVEVPVERKKSGAPRKALAEGKGKKGGSLPTEALKPDVVMDEQVVKQKAQEPRARAQPKAKPAMKTSGPTPLIAPVPVIALPVGKL